MKTAKAQSVDPAQLTFAVVFPPVMTLTKDGSYLVTPGKPVVASWLNPKEFARAMGIDRKSVYRWIESEFLPHELRNDKGEVQEVLVEPEGRRRWRISSKAVAYMKRKLREERGIASTEYLNRGGAETRRLI